VKSTWALDLLRLLKNAHPRSWTAAALTAELRGAPHMVETILSSFSRWGLVVEDPEGRYRYSDASALDPIVSELMELYSQRPVAVIREIAMSPVASPENTQDKIQSFVDAFRLRKD
jgi:DNA-binding IclR family transcriptional regulator